MDFSPLCITKTIENVRTASIRRAFVVLLLQSCASKGFSSKYGTVKSIKSLLTIGGSSYFTDVKTEDGSKIFFGVFLCDDVYLTINSRDEINTYDAFLLKLKDTLVIVDMCMMKNMINSFKYHDEITYGKGFAKIDCDTFLYEYFDQF
jgi:hypothetical protein